MRPQTQYHADEITVLPLRAHLLAAAGGFVGMIVVGATLWEIYVLACWISVVMGWA